MPSVKITGPRTVLRLYWKPTLMDIPLVQNDQGRRRVNPGAAAVLLVSCLVACMLLPAAFFWFALGDRRLVSNALVIGWFFACTSFVTVLAAQLRRPLKSLPRRSSGVDA
jgi:hypothetical protein